MTRRCVPLRVIAVALAAPSAHAFPRPATSTTTSSRAPCRRREVVGSPRLATGTCDTCHPRRGATRRPALRRRATSLLDRGYDASAVFELEVELTNEHVAVDRDNTGPRCGGSGKSFVPRSTNGGFQRETDDLLGEPSASSARCRSRRAASARSRARTRPRSPPTAAPRRPSPPRRVGRAAGGAPNGTTRWHLEWRAAGTGSGPVTLHVGVVDGRGGDGTHANQADTAHYDVAMAHIDVDESRQAPPAETIAGCRTVGSGVRSLGPSLLALALVGLLRRARRR